MSDKFFPFSKLPIRKSVDDIEIVTSITAAELRISANSIVTSTS